MITMSQDKVHPDLDLDVTQKQSVIAGTSAGSICDS